QPAVWVSPAEEGSAGSIGWCPYGSGVGGTGTPPRKASRRSGLCIVHRLIRRDDLVELLEHGALVAALGTLLERRDFRAEIAQIRREGRLDVKDALDGRGLGHLVAADQIFLKLFARPEHAELQRHLLLWDEAGRADAVMREVDDLDLLAHVQHIDIAAPP